MRIAFNSGFSQMNTGRSSLFLSKLLGSGQGHSYSRRTRRENLIAHKRVAELLHMETSFQALIHPGT